MRVCAAIGAAAGSIADTAREEGADLIAMATHGRTGLARLVLGSVATETLQRAMVPLLLLRPASLTAAHDSPAISRGDLDESTPMVFLVALDLTDKADAALEPTARLARASGARVVLVNVFLPMTDMGHVVAEPRPSVTYVRSERRMYLEEKARQLPGVDVDTRVEVLNHGEELDERIASVAAEIGADMVVVVSKRVSSAASVLLGSFARGIVRRSPCPVLVVAPSADHSGSESQQALASPESGRPR